MIGDIIIIDRKPFMIIISTYHSRYEAITSRKLLGKRRRSDNGNELDRISERSKSVDRKRMDKDGFIKP